MSDVTLPVHVFSAHAPQLSWFPSHYSVSDLIENVLTQGLSRVHFLGRQFRPGQFLGETAWFLFGRFLILDDALYDILQKLRVPSSVRFSSEANPHWRKHNRNEGVCGIHPHF
jgi:hypothetical protein